MSSGGDDFDVLYKIVLVGDAGVGKTNLLSYFTRHGDDPVDPKGTAQSFHGARKPTIGVEFGTKTVVHEDGTKIRAQIWDTAGQERYRAITSSHYRRAAGAMLVYDVSSPASFENALSLWLGELREASCDASGSLACVMLAGNKIDLEGDGGQRPGFVSLQKHEEACKREALTGYRTSAKSGVNVSVAFKELIMRVHDHAKSNEVSENRKSLVINQGDSSNGRRSGCGDC